MSIQPSQPNPNLKLVMGIVLVVVGAAGYVTLRVMEIDEAGFLLFLGPFATYLLIGSKVESQTQEQHVQLTKIEKQTNGMLDTAHEAGWKEGYEAGRAAAKVENL
ncbi:MAG: hypothetical protein ACRCY8_02970 [Dermatophilaceae bacterium]